MYVYNPFSQKYSHYVTRTLTPIAAMPARGRERKRRIRGHIKRRNGRRNGLGGNAQKAPCSYVFARECLVAPTARLRGKGSKPTSSIEMR